MARLTVAQKEELIDSVVFAKIAGPMNTIKEKKQKFASDLLRIFNKPYEEVFKTIPEELIPNVDRVRLEYLEEGSRWVGAYYADISLSQCAFCFLYSGNTSIAIFDLRQYPGYQDEFRNLIKAEDRLKDYEKELRKELQAVITPITTDKKLMEILPELGGHLEKITSSTFYPPAVTTEKVKNLLNRTP